MPVSIFLAKAIGLYFVIVSLILLANPERIRKVTFKLLEDEAQIFIAALFTIILGILMVISHNVWAFNWRVWITLISWLVLVKGIMLCLSPPSWLNWTRFIYDRVNLRIAGFVYLIIGLLFCWKSFF